MRQRQVLFQLNPAEFQVKVAEAQASLESALAQQRSVAVEQERVKLLVDKNVITPTELGLIRAKVASTRAAIDQAKAALASAQLLLSQTSIRTPFDGVINRIPFKRGSSIDQGALLTTISDLSRMYVYINISEKIWPSPVNGAIPSVPWCASWTCSWPTEATIPIKAKLKLPKPFLRVTRAPFFIKRPLLSAAISILIVLVGTLALTKLFNTQFPDIVPPSVTVTTRYTGASADVSVKAVVPPLDWTSFRKTSLISRTPSN